MKQGFAIGWLTVDRIKTIVLALAGAALFRWAGMPLPFLFGPMSACLAAALLGVRLQGMGVVAKGVRTILGVAIGASITPEVLSHIPAMALSVALVPVYIVIVAVIGVPYFRRCGFDPVTAWYAAMPGGLQDMILFGHDAGADVRSLSLVHATRVLVTVTLAPIILTSLYGVTLNRPPGAPIADAPWMELAAMAVAAMVGWRVGERIGLFGASMIGPMILTAALSLGGVIHMRPPAELMIVAQVFIGMSIGAHYVGVTMRELRNTVAISMVFMLILAGLTAVFTEIVALAGLKQPLDAFLAFAPAGQSEMAVMAIIIGADVGYVVVHHLTRLVLIITGAPIAARLLGMTKRDP